VTGYTVTSSPGLKICTTAGNLSCKVTGLTNGTSYTFTVTATNAIGTSTSSSASSAVVPAGRPIVVGMPSAVRGDQQASVSWSAFNANGTPVTGYTVTSSPGLKSCTTAGNLSCKVTGLTNGTSYTFTVTATNAVGTSPSSGASSAVVPAGVPIVVGIPSAARGDRRVTVTWVAFNANGSAITGYEVTAKTGASCSAGGSSHSCVVTGLTDGTSYRFTVTATNAVGTSLRSSPSNTVVPSNFCIVPKLRGMTVAAAKAVLLTAECTLGNIVKKYSATPKGLIFSQSPAPGARYPHNAAVSVSVSEGPKP